MSRPLVPAVVAALVLSFSLLWNLFGQGATPAYPPARSASGPTIGLIDVNYVFEKLPHFKQMMDEMKTDVERAEAEVKAERDAIRKLVERLEQYRGTADYKAMEEEVAKRQGDLAVRIQLQKKEFVLREARIYHNVYREIQQQVEMHCAANGIDLVLRFNGDPVDVERPDSVLAYINRPVVYYGKERDITPYILRAFDLRRTGMRPPGPVGTRPDTSPSPFSRPK